MAIKRVGAVDEIQVPSLNIAGVGAFLKDLGASSDTEKPLTCGLFRMDKGKPLDYSYTYHEFKIMLEGQMTLVDEAGERFDARPGDIFYVAKGSKVSFSSESTGLAFYCAQRPEGTL